jgi:hypothetical protein
MLMVKMNTRGRRRRRRRRRRRWRSKEIGGIVT